MIKLYILQIINAAEIPKFRSKVFGKSFCWKVVQKFIVFLSCKKASQKNKNERKNSKKNVRQKLWIFLFASLSNKNDLRLPNFPNLFCYDVFNKSYFFKVHCKETTPGLQEFLKSFLFLYLITYFYFGNFSKNVPTRLTNDDKFRKVNFDLLEKHFILSATSIVRCLFYWIL